MRFVSCLLGQAAYAAEVGPAALATVLGPSEDLLVWILKHAAAQGTGEMRPLQLPTCLRRLFGAMIASEVGPLVEPLLCADQAARVGGTAAPTSELPSPT